MSNAQQHTSTAIRERRAEPSRQHAKKDALTFSRLQDHQQAFLEWLTDSTQQMDAMSVGTYQYVR